MHTNSWNLSLSVKGSMLGTPYMLIVKPETMKATRHVTLRTKKKQKQKPSMSKGTHKYSSL